MHCDQGRPEESQPSQPFHRPDAEPGQALAYLILRLVQVHVDRDLQLAGIGEDLLEAAVAHGIRGVRGQAEGQQRLAAVAVARRQPLAQIVLGVGRIAGGELDADHSDRGPHARVQRRARRLLRIEIHVVEAGHSAAQHLGASQQRAVVDELRRNMLAFRRPDVLVEPLHQGQIVGQAAHQGHGRMRVQVDQPGHENVERQIHRCSGGVELARPGRTARARRCGRC